MTVSKNDRVLAALLEKDPEFAELVATIYGDDVAKMDPDPAALSTSGQQSFLTRNKRRVALAGTVAGAALGAAELRRSAPEAAQVIRSGKGLLVPAGDKASKFGLKRVPAKALTGTATAGTALGADVLATDELKKPVGKLLSVADMAAGLRSKSGALRDLVTGGGGPGLAPGVIKDPAAGKNRKQVNGIRQTASGLRTVAGTTPGKVLLGAGAASTGIQGNKLKNALTGGKPSGTDPGFVDANMGPELSKRDTFDADIEVSKVDLDKQLVFGWASVVKLNGAPVVDYQNDFMTEDDLEEAAYRYVMSSRVGGHMHKRVGKALDIDDAPVHVSDMVESFVFTDEKCAALGLPDDFPRGWWTGFKINDPEIWSEVKKGKLPGFSIHGRGRRQDVPLDSVVGW